MDTETLRAYCLLLPATEEGVKFEDHLAFTLAEKIYCITGFGDNDPVSIKVSPEDFDALTERDGIKQAAYFAKRQWVSVSQRNLLRKKEWEEYLAKSYELVKSKLPKKVQKEIDELK
ncbi:MAG: MmcQ/YjbR family DNA-binding protein [Chitinophagales bacterium]|nr:MmcQ/YjbR family DNA-binding protein [Chitinophagaceae bacterium]MCB9064455.1 MmcQ/YjbR family DNA-binding protein [Chitinophagales bacterium]